MVGQVIWITGLAGVGKTTLAGRVVQRLRAHGAAAVLLDGDDVREAVQDPAVGYDLASRLTNAYRICRLARLLARQDMRVVVATMSLFHEIHVWNRENLPGYLEVYVRVDFAILRARDPRGFYSRAADATEAKVVGLDLRAEEPLAPHLVVENSGPERDLEHAAAAIVAAAVAAQQAGGQ
jgi:adenylylsulfate kinase